MSSCSAQPWGCKSGAPIRKPVGRHISPAPPVTRWGFPLTASRRHAILEVLSASDIGNSSHSVQRSWACPLTPWVTFQVGCQPFMFCGPFHSWNVAEVSMLNVKDVNSKAYTDFIRFPRTEIEVSEKLGLPLWRVKKTLNLLRALTIAEQLGDGRWVRSNWPSA